MKIPKFIKCKFVSFRQHAYTYGEGKAIISVFSSQPHPTQGFPSDQKA